MPEDSQGLVQTIAILAGVIVYLSREAHRAYRARQNGKKEGSMPSLPDPCQICQGQISDLHDWHKPATDPETGQPLFRWYENNRELADEISALRKTMAELLVAVKSYSAALNRQAQGD